MAPTFTGSSLVVWTASRSEPFPDCQGYILSAVSDDGLTFRPEPGIRLAPDPAVPHRSLRLDVVQCLRHHDPRSPGLEHQLATAH